ncbi:hypothetical protein ACWEK5_13515 [Rhodococcus koreensis]
MAENAKRPGICHIYVYVADLGKVDVRAHLVNLGEQFDQKNKEKPKLAIVAGQRRLCD